MNETKHTTQEVKVSKIIWIDTETTGTEYGHEIHEFSYIIEVDKIIRAEGKFKIAPLALSADNVDAGLVRPIDEDALAVSHTTLEDLADPDRYSPTQFLEDLKETLSLYVDRYNKADKFIVAGHNVNFDMRFLQELFLREGDKYMGAWFDWSVVNLLDILHLWRMFAPVGTHDPGKKLTDIAREFGVEYLAHDSLDDIKTTRKLFHLMYDDLVRWKQETPQSKEEPT